MSEHCVIFIPTIDSRYKIMIRSFIIFGIVVASIADAYKRYDGYKVIRVIPEDESAVSALRQMQLEDDTLDFWKEPSKANKMVDIMVHQNHMKRVMQTLVYLNADVQVFIENVQDRIDQEQMELGNRKHFIATKDGCSSFTLNQYHTGKEINQWMTCMAGKYPSIASTFSIGKSLEGRDMLIMKIGGSKAKKGYWIDAGIHAREWITPATAVWIINQLITKYSTDSSIKALVDGINFYIIPSLNPDGYAYTHSNDRMWRKTRSGPYSSGGWFGQKCYGVDPNRNWDNHWGGEGTSSSPCSEIYKGPKAFSEIENKQAADWLAANKANIQSYITLHSYSQDWFYGYGYHAHTYPADVNQLKTVANQAAQALTAVHGTEYTDFEKDFKNIRTYLDAAAGASDDWAKENIGIKWTYALELRDTGYFGFQLPADQIVATAEETWAGLIVVAQQVLSM